MRGIINYGFIKQYRVSINRASPDIKSRCTFLSIGTPGNCKITAVFTGLAFLASVITRDKAKGIGVSILLWLYFAITFDGLILFILFQFSDYPLEKLSIGLTALNPIDLSRILVLLQMDVSAMMGYTGAVFKAFFEGATGYIFIITIMLFWIFSPIFIAVKNFNKKDL